jgi:putative glutamine amidotransferase
MEDKNTTRHPVIGLTSRTLPMRAARQTRPTETVSRSYFEPLEAAGGLPLLIPNTDPERADGYLDLVDGLYLTGGDDPHPHLFDEEPHPKIEVVDERRDHFEIALLRGARARNMPVFGVCRGAQMMAVAFGGDIFQDIESQTATTVAHTQKRLDDGPWHRVTIRPGTLLSRLLGTASVAVNSFHHQACRNLGDTLVPCAECDEDGLIEAVEAPDQAFFLGVQWHPELTAGRKDPLFAGFVEAARQYASAASKV